MEQRARLEEKSPNPEVDHQSEKATEQIGGVKVRSKVTSGIFVNEVRSVLAENQLKDESSAESTKLKQKRDSGREFSISLTQSNDSTESKKGKILLRVGEYEIFFDIDELEEIMEKAADNKDLMEDLLADRFLEEAEKVCQMKITGSCNLERKVMEKLKTKYKGLLIADIASKEPLENEAKTPANISEAESGEKDVSDCLRETKSEAPQMNKESKEETNPPGNLKGDVYAPQLNKEAEVSVERPEIRSQVVEGATDKSEAMDKKNAQSEFAYTAEVNCKSDVYSFGVVTLEVIMGKHPGDLITFLSSSSFSAIDGMLFKDLLDPRLPTPKRNVTQQLMLVAKIAISCMNSNPQYRPTMQQVSMLLSKEKDFPKFSPDITLSQLFGLEFPNP